MRCILFLRNVKTDNSRTTTTFILVFFISYDVTAAFAFFAISAVLAHTLTTDKTTVTKGTDIVTFNLRKIKTKVQRTSVIYISDSSIQSKTMATIFKINA